MKLSNLHLVIILATLIVAIVIAGILLVVFTVGNGPVNPVESTPTAADSTTTIPKNPSAQTTPSDMSNNPTPSTKPATTPSATPSDTSSNPPSSAPDHTSDPPKPTPTPVPDGTVVAGDTVGAMGMFATYETLEEATPGQKAKIRVTFYIESYSIKIGVRTDNYLVVDGVRTDNLMSPLISLPSDSPQTRTVLYEFTCEVDPDSPPTIEYHWHFQGRYSGEEAEWLSVTLVPSV